MEPIQRKPFVPRRQVEQPVVETPKPEQENIAVISHPPMTQGSSAFLAPAKVEEPRVPETQAPIVQNEKTAVTADNLVYWVRKHPVRNAKAYLGGGDKPDYLELQLEHGIVIRVEGIIKVTLGPGKTV